MAKGTNQKQKLLRVLEILLRDTDEQHPIGVAEIISRLEKQGISAERKSIYDDVNTLVDMGYDIISTKGKTAGYFCASREFELPELKLLVDAVQSSKFITRKKSENLIKKLSSLTSAYDADKLQRQVYVFNRVKTENESVLYSIDAIHKAIAANKKIKFRYSRWEVDFEKGNRAKKGYRRDGEEYVVDPWVLVWADENYYLVGFDNKSRERRHYRVEKMENIEETGELRESSEELKNFNPAEYERKSFSMYGGEERTVRVAFKNELVGVVADRFGTGITLSKLDENSFTAALNVVVSKQFFAWIFSLEGGAKILSPQDVANEYNDMLKRAAE